ncbi:MAG: T9SS type A sorting domain-containing protein [Mariniphaga sp.]
MKKLFICLYLVIFLSTSFAQPWTVANAKYEHSMTITARIKINGLYISQSNCWLGAFSGDECRGYVHADQVGIGVYFFFLTVYSNTVEGEKLTFKFNNGIITLPELPLTVSFFPDKILGTTDLPFLITYPLEFTSTDFLGFSVVGQIGTTTIDKVNKTIKIKVDGNTQLDKITSTFIVPVGTNVYVNKQLQVSNLTSNNYAQPVTFTLKGFDGQLTDWVVTVSKSTSIHVLATMIAGWNIISTYVIPANVNLKDIFQQFIDSGSLKKVMDEAGKTIENFGIFGGWTNNIGNLNVTKGYKVNLGAATTLSLEGTPISLPLDIPLSTGWNIISYPCPTAQDGKALVQPLINAGKLIKVMDESGKAIENFGILGGWKNNIGNFTPGKGYKVNVVSDCTLTIPDNPTKAITNVPEVQGSSHFPKVFEGNGTDHMIINIVDLQASGLQDGDEIGIFDGKYCVGAATIGIEQVRFGFISIPASANDGIGTSVNGFSTGNAIILQLYRGNQSYKVSMETLAGIRSFEKNGSIFVKVSASDLPVSQIDNVTDQFICFPNPFKDELTIEIRNSEETGVEVAIHNLLGQKIKNLYKGSNKGELMLKWNGTNDLGNKVAQGVYLCKMNGLTIKIVYKQ